MAKSISVPDIGDFKDVEIIKVLVKPGDKIMKSLTNEYVGVIKSHAGPSITFEGGTRVSLATNDYIHVYPKFEIVKIEIIGANSYITELTPVTTKSIGRKTPDFDTWTSYAQEDFGAADGDGAKFELGELPNGTSIEGRWKRVEIDGTGLGASEGAICYLKATPPLI